MAKPIRATPTLVGKEAIDFIERMRKREKTSPTNADKEIMAIIKENRKLFTV